MEARAIKKVEGTMTLELAVAFIERAGIRPEDVGGLEALLEGVLVRGRCTWPALAVSPTDFAAHLGACVARQLSDRPAPDVASVLEALHTTDLYLARACVSGDARAIESFEAQYLGCVDPKLARIGIPPWAIDETKQVLRCSLYLSRGEGREASLDDYSGRGALQAWVSAAAVNAAFRVLHKPKRQTEADSLVMKAACAPGDDLELDYLKRRYTREFEEALVESFESLSARERTILRCYHLDSAGIDGVAALYGVHRVTAARWVRRVTQALSQKTRARLKDRLRANPAEIASILRLLSSRMDVLVRGVLATSSKRA
jgi:RNA polymerase sigma-70 factor (ECF subfamily)